MNHPLEHNHQLQAELASLAHKTAEGAETVAALEPSNKLYESLLGDSVDLETFRTIIDHSDSVDENERRRIEFRQRKLGAFSLASSGIRLPGSRVIESRDAKVYINQSSGRVLKTFSRNPEDDNTPPAAKVDQAMVVSSLAEGDPRYEQLLGGSYRNGEIVTSYVPGISLETLPAKRFIRALSKYRTPFLSLVEDAYARGVAGDIHPGNVIFDPKKKQFSLIDLTQSDSNYSPEALANNMSNYHDLPDDAVAAALKL